MSEQNPQFYEFGEFRLDARERSLKRGEQFLPLAPKVFDTLFLLVKRHGHIVSKQEMMDLVWADAFVEESNLSQNIYTLRRVLGTDADGNNFIENISRRGYRFTASVKICGNGQPEILTDTQPTENDNTEKNISASPPMPRVSMSLVWFGIGSIALLLAGFAVFKFLAKQNENNVSAPSETVRFQKLTFTGDISYPVLAPDGKSFAFTKDGNLFLQEIESGNIVRVNVEGEKIFGFLRFSLDGSSIYFRNRRTINLAGNVLRVSRFGGAAQTVAENVWSGFSFTPDATAMAFIRFSPDENEYALILKNLESGAERKLTVRRPPNGFSYYNGSPAWSPDGKKIAIAVQNNQQTPASETVIIDVESGGIEELKTPRFRQIEQFAWMPDGASLLVVARENNNFFQLWRISYPNGEIRRITNDLNIYRALSLSADGTKLLTRQFTTYAHIWTASADDFENERQITFGNLSRDGMNGLSWTADGNLIYSARIIADLDLWFLRPSDGLRRQLTENSGDFNENPAVSADGKFIFFNSNRSGSKHIWRMDANGENQTQMTFGESEIELFPAASADGKWLYYLQRGGKQTTIWRKSLADGQAEPLVIEGKFSPNNFLSLAPDGKHLAFHNLTDEIDETAEKQTLQIVIVSTENASAPKIFNLSVSPVLICWTNGGASFDYAENSDESAKILRQSLDEKTPPQLILTLPKERIFKFVWSADGKNLALSRGRQQNDAVLLMNF